MLKLAPLLVPLLLVACSKDKPKASPDWGDDPRPLGSCVGTAKPTTKLAGDLPRSFCLEHQTARECTGSTLDFDYSYAEHTTCASRGYDKKCEDTAGNVPASARFATCIPPSPSLAPAKQVVAIFASARTTIAAGAGDCAEIGKQLAPLRDQLLAVTKAHPSVLDGLTSRESDSIKAHASFNELHRMLRACRNDQETRTFLLAMGTTM